MSGDANPASDVIVVMEAEPDAPGGGYHRPLRKRTRTTRALESEQQKGDMEWQEEESSEGSLSRTRTKNRTTPKAAGSMNEAIQGLRRLLEQNFNKKVESMKAEFQLEFSKFRDRMAEDVTSTTAQMAQELSQVREQLTMVCSELEQTRLQLDTVNNSHAAQSPRQTYADAARLTPVSITTQTPPTARSATPEPVFCTETHPGCLRIISEMLHQQCFARLSNRKCEQLATSPIGDVLQ
jgi:hypothetical protein